MSSFTPSRAVILVGHGAPPKDAPPELVQRLKALEGRRRAAGSPPSDEERALDERLRRWPRDATNDPYVAGLEAIARALAARLPDARVTVAYNEFCAPSLREAVERAVADGAEAVTVVPSMLTRGGVHSEIEIPEELAAIRAERPGLTLGYAFPFDDDAVAALLAAQVARAV
jgi:sirohydrochlorin cobaltochelatase